MSGSVPDNPIRKPPPKPIRSLLQLLPDRIHHIPQRPKHSADRHLERPDPNGFDEPPVGVGMGYMVCEGIIGFEGELIKEASY
jgi:hypothetical protein